MSTLPPSRSTPYRAPVMSSQHNTAVTASLRSLAYHGVLPMADSLFGPEIRMVKHDGEIQDLPSCITDSENTRKLHGNDRTTARIFRCRLDSAAVERPHPDPPDFLSAAAVCYNTAAVPAVNPAGRALCRNTVPHPPCCRISRTAFTPQFRVAPMSRPHVVIPADFPPLVSASPFLPRLKSIAEYTLYNDRPQNDAEKISLLADADILLNSRGSLAFPRHVLQQLPRLKMIAVCGIGFDSIHLPTATEQGIIVANVPGRTARVVAEHALGLMLAV